MKAKWMVSGVLAATLLLAACGDDDLGDDNDSGGRPASQSAAATPAASEQLSSGAAALYGSDGNALPSIDPSRKIIFTATMALDATDVGQAFNDAGSLAKSNGGYIEKSTYTNDASENTRRSASLTIRVPVQNYDSLIGSLRMINGVSVRTEGSNSNEVTEQYIDLQSNQRNLERTEQQYLELLKQAKTIQEVLTVQDRLTSVRSQIEQIQGRLKVLDGLTEFATVNLNISPVLTKSAPKDSKWTMREVLVESWEGSVEVARYTAAAGLVLMVVAVWLVIPVTLAIFGTRRFRRRVPPALPPPPPTAAGV